MEKKIKLIISQAVNKLGLKKDIELTPSKNYADYSTNIALKLASELQDTPLNIANKIIRNIKGELIEKVEFASPGFINIFIAGKQYGQDLAKILVVGEKFGKSKQGKNINVEYVSANPTGYLHVGHARGAAIGDSLSKILRFAGNKVSEEYWLNDSGVQINILGQAVWTRYQQLLGNNVAMPKDTYKGQDIIDCAKSLLNNKFKDKYLGTPYAKVESIFKQEAIAFMLIQIKMDLNSFGVNIQMFTSEQKVIEEGSIDKAFKVLEKYIYHKDGATWLQTTIKGDDKDRVVVKADGSYTYFAPDIAGHAYKIWRGHDELINIFGADHIGYGPRLKIAVELLGLPSNKFSILFLQMVALLQDGKPLKMSKRKGTSFTLKDLINLVGKDAARYFLVSRSNRAQLDFDVNKVSQKSSDNPVFLIQYSHARAYQLLEKSSAQIKTGQYQGLEKKLITFLNNFPKIILKIAQSHNVHYMPRYLLELSRLFNSFYSNCKIINTPRESELMALVKAVKVILKTGLSLIGVSAPNKI